MVSTRSSEVTTGDKRKVDEPTEGTSPAKLQKTGGEADVTNNISVTEEQPPADPAAVVNGAGEAVSSAVDSVKEKAAEVLPDVSGAADTAADSTTPAADSTSTEESAPVTATEKVAAAVTSAVDFVQEKVAEVTSSDNKEASTTSTETPAAAVESAVDTAAEKLGTADAVTAEPERAQAS